MTTVDEVIIRLARHTTDTDSERTVCACGALFEEGPSQLEDKRAWAKHALEQSGVVVAHELGTHRG